ncbi:TRAP transporter large permease [Oceanispirochaeta sp.]|jgi:tripartite ATP-independent transporter DctM subunit|uniref:TRAP transporter large permease n=1 Tax=Oceanispirochaeta sp. TaxID=2035350 RepID=UPI002603F1F5|nr:TRAP transporter large permease [Oceanispirochaeta sp.]MDA3957537.1 TRAP transporter large permease [Oceanispirochaeta sp.]
MPDPNIAIAILLGSFVLMMVIGQRIALAMGISAVLTTMYLQMPVQMIAINLVKGVHVFVLQAVPFFVIAGALMGEGGISNRLIGLSKALIGWMRGGLAMVNILASMFFGGISGSATADTSSIGSIMIPMMKKDGYDGEFATTVTMASSIQGLLVPPSHNFVIFAMAAGGVSIGKLFMGGLVPGIFLGIALMVYCYFISVLRKYPKGEKFDLRFALKSTYDSSWGLLTVLIVVVGVVGGIVTATEAAAIAVIWSFFVTFVIYREIPLRSFFKILRTSLETLSIVMILIASAGAFGWLVAFLKIPALFASGIMALTSSKFVILILINFLLLFLGTLTGMSALIVIMTPILLPIVLELGMDPVHFGVVMILNLGIGLITPPVGGVLFIGSAISRISIEKLSKAMIPFYLVMVSVLLAITYIPQIVMTLPNLFYK